MSRIFLIGTGPLPSPGQRGTGFPTLRTHQFLTALLGAGHDVRWASLVTRAQDDGFAPQGQVCEAHLEGHGYERVTVRADEPGRFLMLRDLRHEHRPDAVVTAGPFLPMGAGARATAEEPLWIDVPGDPMAEAQSRAARDGNDVAVQRYREMYGWALGRGDRFSVISAPQRHSLIGALGVSGRLVGGALGEELVVRIAAALPQPLATAAPSSPPSDATCAALAAIPPGAPLLLSIGGFNTWLDDETMADAILRVMATHPDLHFVATGGSLTGHDEGTWPRFRDRLLRDAPAGRHALLGWVPDADLPSLLARADVLFFLDRMAYEPELGGRTRVLDALRFGLGIVGTAGSEMVRELRGHPGFFEVDRPRATTSVDQRSALATTQLEHALTTRRRYDYGAALDAHAQLSTCAPLLQWAAAPKRAAARAPVDFLEESWAELARLQDRLEHVWNSPTWRTLGRLHRALLRRRGP